MDRKEILERVREAETGVKEEVGKGKGKLIPIFISIVVSIVVGVAFMPDMLDTLRKSAEEQPSAFGPLIEVVPYLFIALMLLGAVAWIFGLGRGEEYEEVEELSEADEIRKLQRKKRRHIIYEG